MSTTDFIIELVSDSLQSNFYIFFGSGNAYTSMYPSLSNLVEKNWGLFYVYWDSSNKLFRGHMYVDVYRARPTDQKHLLREELTQSLGLGNDSERYFDSIFRQSYSSITEYSQIDKELIRLLYHPKMKIGLARDEVDYVLRSILLAEQ